MREELETKGEKSLQSDKMSFIDLADKYEKNKIVKAKYQNGKKVSGRRSVLPVKTSLNALKQYFGKKKLRDITPNDLEKYKNKRLNTPTIHGTQRKIASVNRELELLRAMLNFAYDNSWIIENPFSRMKSKSLISKASETQRDRVMSFEEEKTPARRLQQSA